jgi:ribosomal protein S27E
MTIAFAHVLCPDCFKRLWPNGHEEKSCAHGFMAVACVECGKARKLGEKPYWPCLGTREP